MRAMHTKAQEVARVFASVAARYDLMNDLMSWGLHRLWKRELVAAAFVRPGMTVVDVAAGTGDVARLIRRRLQGKGSVILVDPSAPMLTEAVARNADAGWVQGAHYLISQGEALALREETADRITIAFGLRNFADPLAGLKEMHRVLKTGGRFVCLEFSRPASLLRPAYDLYSFFVIPTLGEAVVGDRASYDYLVRSIRGWYDAPQLARIMERAGFARVGWRRMTGGIVALHWGWKL